MSGIFSIPKDLLQDKLYALLSPKEAAVSATVCHRLNSIIAASWKGRCIELLGFLDTAEAALASRRLEQSGWSTFFAGETTTFQRSHGMCSFLCEGILDGGKLQWFIQDPMQEDNPQLIQPWGDFNFFDYDDGHSAVMCDTTVPLIVIFPGVSG